MHCASCVSNVEKALGSIPGVLSAAVNLGSGRASVDYPPGIASVSVLRRAIEASDITLMTGNPMSVVNAIRLSHRTLQTIRQNLSWAFAHNNAGIPIATGVLYPLFGMLLNPMITSLAMAFSSVSVLLNSLRLRGVQAHLD